MQPSPLRIRSRAALGPAVRFRFAGSQGSNLLPARIDLAFVDQAAISATNFLTGVIVARALGVEAFGVFALAWLTLLLLQSLQHALITAPLLSIGPKQRESKADAYYSAAFAHQMIVGSASSLIILLVGFGAHSLGHLQGVKPLIHPLAVCVFVTQLHEFLRRSLFARDMIGHALWADLARNTPQLAGLSFLMLHFDDVASVSAALYTIAACAGVGVLATIRSMPSLSTSRSEFAGVWRRHMHFSKWLLGSAILQWASSSIYVIASGALLGAVAAGALKASQTLLGTTHVFFLAAENILSPVAARIHGSGRPDQLRAFVRSTMLVAGSLTGVACLIFALPAELWLSLLFGHEFIDYGFVVKGLAIAYALMALALPLRLVFMAKESTSHVFTGHLLATSVAVVAFYPLVKHFGLSGAVAGTIMTHGILVGNLWLQYRRQVAPE